MLLGYLVDYIYRDILYLIIVVIVDDGNGMVNFMNFFSWNKYNFLFDEFKILISYFV